MQELEVVEVSRMTSKAKLQEAARRGNAEAQCRLAAVLASGDGASKDAVGAVRWYGKAARSRHPDATYNLALMHLLGEGTKKDVRKAAQMLKTATTLGSTDAAEFLGDAFLSGLLGMTDPHLAALHYIRAIGRGSARAAFLLGIAIKEKRIASEALCTALIDYATEQGVRDAAAGAPKK